MNALRSLMAAVAVGACALPAPAADEPKVAAPAPVYAAPVAGDPAGGTCSTCGKAGPTVGCSTCGKLLRGHARFGHKNEPFQVNLCPGACFGYFQTQWRKWEDACPYPYIGHGVSDAPRRPTPPLAQPGTGLGQPRTVDPKAGEPKKVSGGLPPIPDPMPMPKGKFDP